MLYNSKSFLTLSISPFHHLLKEEDELNSPKAPFCSNIESIMKLCQGVGEGEGLINMTPHCTSSGLHNYILIVSSRNNVFQ